MKNMYTNFATKFSVSFKVIMLVGMMGVGVKGWGQAASATWAGTVDNSVAVTGAVNGGTQSFGPSNTGPNFSGTLGFFSQGWGTSAYTAAQTVFYQFSLSPTVGNNLTVTSVSLQPSISGPGSATWAVYYSTSPSFTSPIQIGVNTTVNSTTPTTTTFSSLSVIANTGNTLYFRFVAGSADVGTRNIRVKNFIINGTTVPACTPPSITTNPTDATICTATNTTFTAATSAGSPTYQWEASANGSTGWANVVNATPAGSTYTNATTNALTVISSAAIAQYFYRCKITASACDGFTTAAKLIVNTSPTITTNPSNATAVCGSGNTIFTVLTTGSNLSYQWQASADGSTGWGSVVNGTPASSTYTNSTTASLNANTINATYYYRVVVSNTGCTAATSTAASLVVNPLPANPIGTISGTTPACGSTLLNYSSPSATEYWQTTATGTSAVNPTTTGLNVITSGNYYVRVYNGTCWSVGSTAAFAIVINSSPSITVQPSNQTISTPTAATFSLTATSAFGYQWQVNTGSGFVNVTTGVGGTTNSYTTAATTAGMNGYVYKCIVKGIAPCGDISSIPATLIVSTGPCINEGFAAGVTPPSGWAFTAIGGTYISAGNYGLSSPSLQFDATGDRVQTPVIVSASQLSFWMKGQASGSSSFLVEGFNGVWVTIENIAAIPSTGTTFTYNSSSTPSLPIGITQFRFTYTRTTGNVSFDDVKVFCNAACPPTTTVSSLLPSTGPINTRVTITGTGFSNTSVVKFGALTAVSTYKNAATIEAIVPAGITTLSDIIVSNSSGCFSLPFTGFTLITTTGSCGISDLIISEVYDAASGNNHYIEIYNGTLNVINLESPDYELSVVDNPGNNVTTWNISGTIAPGGIAVYYAGANGGLANGTQANAGNGFNDGFDEIRLLKNGVILDRVIAPNEVGYSIKRNTNITAPNATYTASEWTVLSSETTADITYFNATIPIYVVSNPVDQICSFSMNITASGIPTTYQWKYFNKITSTWDAFNNGASTVLAPAFVSGSTSSTLNITGDISNLYKYQFYCEIAKAGCTNASYAAEFSYDTKSYYRSNLVAGNWTTPSSWLMSDDNITYVPTCGYPTAANSSQVIIQNGHKITFAVNSLFLEENKVTIENGGEFELGTSAQIKFFNKQVAADFLVNGSFIDRSSSGNGIYFEIGATWILGANGTIVKTNSASVNAYQATYEGGVSTIPATANWIFRYNGDGAVAITTTQMYYPNLTFESVNGVRNATGLTEKFSGSGGGFATVKGNLDVGGTQGLGTYTLYNENTNAQPMLINGNLIIRTGSTLSNGASTAGTGFEVKGDITVDGVFNVNTNSAGILLLSGTTAQLIGGSNGVADNMNIQNCTITNTIGVVENKNFNIFGTNTYAANSKLDFGFGIISLKSNATKTANIAPIPTTASITYSGAGRFIVERYLRAFKAWRFLATPLGIDATLKVKEAWQEAGAPTVGYGTQITGPGGAANGMDQTSVRASMKYYETNAGDFVDVTNTNTATIANKEGYFLFVRGDRTIAGGGTTGTTTMRIRGKILTGDQSYTVGANRFLSIGNPYASQIDFKQVVIPSGIEASYTVWNPNPVGTIYNAGKYEQRVKQLSGNYEYLGTVENFIESGQGFFIQGSAGGGGTIDIKEEHKTTGSNLASRGGEQGRVGVTIPTLEINLYAKDVDGSFIKADAAFQNFDNGFSTAIDNNDVKKIMNASDNIAIEKASYKLIAERRKPLEATDTIFLHLSSTRVAGYQFLIDPSVLSNTGLEAFLQDKFLQTSTAVSLVDSTLINFNITADAASKVADRFMIVFKQGASASFTTIAALRNADKTITVNWGIANEKNVTNYTVEQSSDGVNFTAISTQNAIANNGTNTLYTKLDAAASKANNWYRIKITNANATIKYSSIAMVAAIKEDAINTTPSIAIEPNIVVDGIVNLKWKNKQKGNYTVEIYNSLGQKIKVENIFVQTNNELQLIKLANTANGKYYAIIRDEAGNKTIIDFVLR
jgi:hypothetical protein